MFYSRYCSIVYANWSNYNWHNNGQNRQEECAFTYMRASVVFLVDCFDGPPRKHGFDLRM